MDRKKLRIFLNRATTVLIVLGIMLVIVMVLISAFGEKKDPEVPETTTPKAEQTLPPETTGTPEPTAEPTPEPTPEPITFEEFTLISAGDAMVYPGMTDTAKKRGNGKIDFGDVTKYLPDVVADADFAVLNFEATLLGDKNYSGYPSFNVPDEFVTALKEVGFDAALFANNHTYDTGHKGLIRTQQVLCDSGLLVFGTRKSETEKSYGIVNVGSVKMGVLDYTYEAPCKDDGSKYLNWNEIDKGDRNLIDSFNENNMAAFYQEVSERITELKNEGAEIITVYVHWGEEYEEQPNENQRNIAGKLCEMGVDLLIGSHPHVVEPVETFTDANGHRMLCYYSLGNFTCSVNRVTYPAHGVYIENELLAKITFRKYSNGVTVVKEAGYEPLWQHYHSKDGRMQATVVPLRLALESDASKEKYGLNESSAGVKNAEAAFKYITGLIQPGIDKFNSGVLLPSYD